MFYYPNVECLRTVGSCVHTNVSNACVSMHPADCRLLPYIYTHIYVSSTFSNANREQTLFFKKKKKTIHKYWKWKLEYFRVYDVTDIDASQAGNSRSFEIPSGSLRSKVPDKVLRVGPWSWRDVQGVAESILYSQNVHQMTLGLSPNFAI